MIINVTDGKTPYIGDNGTWWIGGTDTGVIAAGTDGIDGTTPHIGANGNWFIGAEDTGTSAQGGGDTSIIPVALISSNWDADNASQNISVSGILEDETKQIITIVPFDSSMELYEDCDIECTAFGVDNLTFTAKTIPAEDISVYVILENVTGGKDTASNVYSTEETVVGTWIDGKPIYRRVFVGVMDSDEYTRVCRLSEIDGESVVNMSAICNHSSSSTAQMPTGYYGSNGAINIYRDGSGQIILYVSSGDNFKSQPYTAIVEYTKTTDTATIEIPSAMALQNSYEQGVNES